MWNGLSLASGPVRDIRALSRKPEPSSASAEWEHAKLAVQEFGGWIRNADTKITILAAALSVSLTFALPRAVATINDAHVFSSPREFWIVVVLAIAGAVFAVASGYNLFRALAPRVMSRASTKTTMNRFSWPSMAAEPVAVVPAAPGAVPPRLTSRVLGWPAVADK